MAPKQIKLTARDLVAKDKNARVRAVYDVALKHAYEDQQKILEQAKRLA